MDFTFIIYIITVMEDDTVGVERELFTNNTLVERLNTLMQAGFCTQFAISGEVLRSASSNKLYEPSNIKSLKYYRFEGITDASENSVLFVLETTSGERGTAVERNGNSPDTRMIRFFKKVQEFLNSNLVN